MVKPNRKKRIILIPIGIFLSAVAEIERENIRVQTMEGRMQKAREGKWNGGTVLQIARSDRQPQYAEESMECIKKHLRHFCDVYMK